MERNGVITTTKNNRVDRWRKLQGKRDVRRSEASVLVEGKSTIRDVIRRHTAVAQHLILREDESSFLSEISCALPYTIVAPFVFEAISHVQESEGVILECALPAQKASLLDIFEKPLGSAPSLVLLLDQLQDPGNIGTLLRTAVAFGVEALVMVGPCCDVWNPKVVRAGKGAHFELPIFESTWEEILWLQGQSSQRTALLATFPPGEDVKDIAEIVQREKSVQTRWLVALGNETHGVRLPHACVCEKATIPISTNIESLNVSQAGAIVLYLASRK